MALTTGTPNPLNYFNLRRVVYAPPHFTYFTIKKFSPPQFNAIEVWIHENLDSRYFIGRDITLDKTNTIMYTTRIGFENELEMTFFKIACLLINE